MSVILSVHLHKLIFHGFHGIYEGEEKTGNEFEVSLDIHYRVKKEKLANIRELIDYEAVVQQVRRRMEIPTPILEELAYSITQKIKHTYPQIEKMQITVYKLNAAITRFQGKVGITVTRTFDR
ncbi:MAG: dihydroneopterin aldolase [Flavihumibacter sp.]